MAGRFCRKPERRSVAPHARRSVGQGTTQLARHENHACTMSDEHHNRWSDSDVSRLQSIGDPRCGVGVGGELRTLALQPHTVTVLKFVQVLEKEPSMEFTTIPKGHALTHNSLET